MKFIAPLFIASLYCQLAAAAELVGEARDLESGDPLYTEIHRFSEDAGREVMSTTYLTPQNELLAKRQVEFANDRVARYELEQTRLSRAEAIERAQDLLTIKVAEEDDREAIVAVGDKRADVIIDAGFSNYIVRNWENLLAGDKGVFYFASTAQMDVVKLQLKLAREQAPDSNIAMFEMTSANALFRLLIKPVKVGYYRDTRQLAFYRGVSNLKDVDGDNFNVEITFENNQLPFSSEVALR